MTAPPSSGLETRPAAQGGPGAPGRSSRLPLSVVIPVLDEERSIEELHTLLVGAVPADAEILYVDDGSSDASPRILADLARRDARVRAVLLRRRSGKSAALSAGFRRARGGIIATLDADLQDDPAEIPRLLAKLDEGYDLATGWRRERKDPPLKVLGSKLFNRAASLLGGVRLRDINCGLKVMRREVLDDIVLSGGFHRFIPLLAHWRGFAVAEVEVRHAPRKHGASRYGGDRAARGLLDLIVLLFLVRHEGRPARYFAGIGTLMGIAGLAISGYLAGLRIITGSIQSKFPLLALGLVLLIVGVQLFSLGLFGELLAYHFRARRPFEPAAREIDGGAEEDGDGGSAR